MADLKYLFDFYQEGVKEGNEKGFGDLYKAALEYFFEQINNEIEDCSYRDSYTVEKFNFTDIEYDDGYFIFGRGDNMVDRFHIKEIPGWLFGVWFREPEKMEDGRLSIKFDVFWQYEDNIDKFKPSRSEFHFVPEIVWSGEKFDYMTNMMDVTSSLMFTHNEPELAFCRDYCRWDYNKEYHTRAEAKKEYTKYVKYKQIEEEQTAILDKVMLDRVKELFADKFESGDGYIIDKGDGWYPRYDLVVNINSYEKGTFDEGPGCYSIDDELYNEFNKAKKQCEKIANKYNILWFSPIDAFMHAVEPDVLEALKNYKEDEK